MPSNDFLSALSGLVQGVNVGLAERKERQNVEKERAFRLRAFESEQRRNAILDALNEKVASGRLEQMQRELKLQEDASAREEKNLEEIPYHIAGKTYMVPRGVSKQLEMARAQQDILQEGMVPYEVGGNVYRIDPGTAAGLAQEQSGNAARRRDAINKLMAEQYQAIREANTSLSDNEALAQTIKFGKVFFPDEFQDVMPEDFMPAVEDPNAPQYVPFGQPMPPNPGRGVGDRLNMLLRGGMSYWNPDLAGQYARGAFAPDPVEALRAIMYDRIPNNGAAQEAASRRTQALLAQRGLIGSVPGLGMSAVE